MRIALAFAFCLRASVAAAQSNGFWQFMAPMPTARQELASAALNGKLYTLAGYDRDLHSTALVEVYDPATNTWSTAHPLPSATNHNAAAVAGGKLYSINNSTVLVYDPTTDSWMRVASTNSAHGGTPAVGVIGDKIYIAGGFAAASTRALEVYDPATNAWTTLAPMQVARNHCAGGVIDGKFYVVGGRGTPGAEAAFEVYDPDTNTWQTLPPLPTPRSGVAAGVLNNELFVFGGETPGVVYGDVEAYNPATNSWRTLSSMPHPRHGMWASVIGDKIYIPGGAESDGFGGATDFNDAFILDPTPARFANISTRMRVETGDNVLIGGFIVVGNEPKRILVRAPGPSVPVPGVLDDTTLELFDSNGQPITSNDNWMDAPNRQEIIDSTLVPSHPLEAAILTTVPPGAVTAIVRGANNHTGVALVEVFDLASGSPAKLGNVSTRGFVKTGDDQMIGGVIVNGGDSLRTILRALGPSLPLEGRLADPMLELRDSNGQLLAANDNWRSTQEAETIATGIPPPHDAEAAIVRTLLPGAYTALVRGVNGTTGVGLIEAYSLP